MKTNEIFSARILNYPVEMVYNAFANSNQLRLWWGPEEFTNTIHEFDLQPSGNWILTMHGPDKVNYENASVFDQVMPNQFVSWKRKTHPLFNMEIAFEKLDENKMQISFRMIFETAEACDQIRKFVEPKNEENFDRLERVLEHIENARQ